MTEVSQLSWPVEMINKTRDEGFSWSHMGSNISLDFHGNPCNSDLYVFSDGNHHMALEESIQEFVDQQNDLGEVFYATTPPGVLVNVMQNRKLQLGNLSLTLFPDVFISPVEIMDKLVANTFMKEYNAIARSQGNVLLVANGNPKQIQSIDDLMRDDVCLFISNPVTEVASHVTYRQEIEQVAARRKIPASDIVTLFDDNRDNTVFGERIHHREAPQAVISKAADAAVVYYHLALRYTRIFPDQFDIVSLDGSDQLPPATESNPVCTTYYAGLIGDGGKWGNTFLDFMQSKKVQEIYTSHGLTSP